MARPAGIATSCARSSFATRRTSLYGSLSNSPPSPRGVSTSPPRRSRRQDCRRPRRVGASR
eukprot:3847692-Lingulodinium_polyedra.AAC.1